MIATIRNPIMTQEVVFILFYSYYFYTPTLGGYGSIRYTYDAR
jgi:hypothetical protein